MDLVASIRKQGSRGGVNFNWEDVTTSAHRENYLGHSLKAPVGRWQKGRDLSWYAKADTADSPNETAEEKAARERKEELLRIKEAEHDALARALGLPVAQRNVTGANAVDVSQPRMAQQTNNAPEEIRHHRDTERRHRRRHQSRSRDRDRRGHRREHDRNRDRRRSRSPPREGQGMHRTRSREGRDDRRTRRRSHSREQSAHRPRKLHGRDEHKGRGRGEFEDRRGRRDDHR